MPGWPCAARGGTKERTGSDGLVGVGGDRRPVDHRGPRLRRRYRLHHRGDAAEPRGPRARRHPRHARACTLHNPVLAYENGDDFLARFRLAADGTSSAPSSSSSRARSRTRRTRRRATGPPSAPTRTTGQPIPTCDWIDRLAPQRLGRRRRRHLRHLRRHPRDGGQPDRLHGPARLSRLGAGTRRPASRSSACPAARSSPTTSWRRCSTCSTRRPGRAPMIPLDDALRPTWLFGQTVHEGCDRGGYYEQADFAAGVRLAASASSSSAAGGRSCSATSASAAGWAASAAAPTSAASASAARCRASPTSSCRSWTSRPARSCRRPPCSCTAARSARCATSPRRRSTASRVGATGTSRDGRPRRRPTGAGLHDRTSDRRRIAARRHVLGSDHPDRREPRHPHEDRLRQPAGRRVPQHVVDLPRLQRLHEGQGPARRPLHHEPHLRHLRRQPRDLRRLRAEHGVRRQAAAPRRVDHQPRRGRRVHVRPQPLPGQPGRRRLLRADGQGDQPVGAREGRDGPPRRTPRVHGYRTIADIMRALNPFTGDVLPRGAADEPAHARDVLPDGGPPRPPLDALPGRRRHRADGAALHRLPGAAA